MITLSQLERIPVVTKELARMKQFAQYVSNHLATANPDSPLKPSYEKTAACIPALRPLDKYLVASEYCGFKWCPICQSNRASKLMSGYDGQVSRFKNPHIVTLTVPLCTAADLEGEVDLMEEVFDEIKRTKTFKKIKGLRKVEYTTRGKGVFRPHYHVLVEGEANAKTLIDAWVDNYPDAAADQQTFKAVELPQISALFMYNVRICTKDENGELQMMDGQDLDTIFQVSAGRRIFLPFGGVRAVSEGFTEEDLVAVFRRDDNGEGTKDLTDEAKTDSDEA